MATATVGEAKILEANERAWELARKELTPRFEPPLIWDTSHLREVTRRSEDELHLSPNYRKLDDIDRDHVLLEETSAGAAEFTDAYMFYSGLVEVGLEPRSLLLHGILPPKSDSDKLSKLDDLHHASICMALAESHPFWIVGATHFPDAELVIKLRDVVADVLTYSSINPQPYSINLPKAQRKDLDRVEKLVRANNPSKAPMEFLLAYMRARHGEDGAREFYNTSDLLNQEISIVKDLNVLRRGRSGWQTVSWA